MSDIQDQGRSAISTSLAPGFLVAAPNLKDPNFSNTLILMAEHNQEGALGFVVNRALSVNLEDLLEGVIDEEIEVNPRDPDMFPVLWGGPVQTRSVWVLFERQGEPLSDNEIAINDHLAIGASEGLLEAFVSGARSGHFHILLGYAGWGPHQLEEETASGAWLPLDIKDSLIFDEPIADRWEAALRALGLVPGGFIMGGAGGMA